MRAENISESKKIDVYEYEKIIRLTARALHFPEMMEANDHILFLGQDDLLNRYITFQSRLRYEQNLNLIIS